MAAETQGFRVDADELLQVAHDVQALLDEVSGADGNVAGNLNDFMMNAETTNVSNALVSLFPHAPPSSAFTEAYRYEYEAMQLKYEAIIDQLTELQLACRTTAEAYGAEDDTTRAAINVVDPGAFPGPGAPVNNPSPGERQVF